MVQNDKLLSVNFGLKVTGISILVALIFGAISSFKEDNLTSSLFNFVWPIIFGILTITLFLLSRLINKELGFGILVLLALMNVFFNIVLLLI